MQVLNATNKAQIDALSTPTGNSYDKQDDQRVITTTETQYINNVNASQQPSINSDDDLVTPQQQSTRTDHRGSFYPTVDVNSITPADKSTIIGVKL